MFREVGVSIARPSIRFIQNMIGTPAPILNAALDGSGGMGDKFVSYAGVAGIAPSWEVFDYAWVEVLQEYGLPYLHTVQAMNWRGPFAAKVGEWGDQRLEKRDGLLLKCASVIVDSHLQSIGFASDVRNFKANSVVGKKKELFDTVLGSIIGWLKPSFVMTIFCDDEQDTAEEYYKLLNRYRRAHQGVADKIAGICFHDDKVFPPLQAADLVAWTLREELERSVVSPEKPQSERYRILIGENARFGA